MSLTHFKNLGPLIINLDSTELSNNERQLIEHELVGGIILFSHNFLSKKQLLSLVNDIKSVKNNLLVTIDHEGGRVQRLLNGFTHLPSFEKISEIKDASLRVQIAYQAGYISAYELSEVNIDINYINQPNDVKKTKLKNISKDNYYKTIFAKKIINEYLNNKSKNKSFSLSRKRFIPPHLYLGAKKFLD